MNPKIRFGLAVAMGLSLTAAAANRLACRMENRAAEGTSVVYSIEYLVDTDGLLIEEKEMFSEKDLSRRTVYLRDAQKRLLSKCTEFVSSGKAEANGCAQFKYQGKSMTPSEVRSVDATGKVIVVTKSTYDAQGRELVRKSFEGKKKKPDSEETRTYSSTGHLERLTFHSFKHPNAAFENFFVEYRYNEKGERIQETAKGLFVRTYPIPCEAKVLSDAS
jgi:hypothetical protein